MDTLREGHCCTCEEFWSNCQLHSSGRSVNLKDCKPTTRCTRLAASCTALPWTPVRADVGKVPTPHIFCTSRACKPLREWDGTSSVPRHDFTADEVEQLHATACRPLYDVGSEDCGKPRRSHPLAAVVLEGNAHCWWQLARMHLIFPGLPVDAPGIEQAPARMSQPVLLSARKKNTHGATQSGVPMAWRGGRQLQFINPKHRSLDKRSAPSGRAGMQLLACGVAARAAGRRRPRRVSHRHPCACTPCP